MDLGAYAQIEILEDLAIYNNIKVPRLRGYRWMKYEEPYNISQELTKDAIEGISINVLEELLCSVPFFSTHPEYIEYCDWTDYLCKFYETKDGKVDWSKIHGWKRKVLKTEIHNKIARIKKQDEIWNKYAGKEDVLYIHSRIGGPNFIHYGGPKLAQNDWWLEKIDDQFDGTYCDIYARIKIPEGFEEKYLASIYS